MQRFRRAIVVRLLAVLVVACSTLMVSASPAAAAGVGSRVQHGQTWLAQWLSEESGDPCDDGGWFHQTMRVEWEMFVFHDGITGNKLKLTIWNDYLTGLTVGRRTVWGANRAYSIPPSYEYPTAANGASWTKAYTVDRYFTWQSGKWVNLSVVIPIPCGGGFRESLFQLEKGF